MENSTGSGKNCGGGVGGGGLYNRLWGGGPLLRFVCGQEHMSDPHSHSMLTCSSSFGSVGDIAEDLIFLIKSHGEGRSRFDRNHGVISARHWSFDMSVRNT